MARPVKRILNEWDGYVEEIVGDEFIARLRDTKSKFDYCDEEATFPITVLSEFDRKGLKQGRYLKWTIYKVGKEVKSRVWLRRWLWKKRDLERADRWAKKMSKLFEQCQKGEMG